MTCLIVSLSVYYSSNFDSVLQALYPVNFWWQRFTTLFAHGNYEGVPIVVHLPGNILAILAFIVLCEIVISPKMFLQFFTISLGASVCVMYGFKMEGNGISSVPWSFIPPATYICYTIGRRYLSKQNIGSLIIVLLMATWAVIIYPFVFGNSNFHNFGVALGIIFTLIFRKQIKERVDHIYSNERYAIVKKSTSPA